MDSSTENQLINILIDLNRIDGVESGLISDSNGNVLCHSMSRGTDTSLFGPMAHVITSSSKRLLSSADQGEIERVLVESKEGKALFLHLGNVYFIVIMEVSANVGFVMVSAKRAALNIIELTKDMVFVETVEEEAEVPEEVSSAPKSEIDKIIESEEMEHKEIEEVVEKITETEGIAEAFDKVVGTEKLDEIMESSEFKSLDSEEAKEKLEEMLELKSEEEISTKPEIEDGSEKIAPPIKEKELKSEIKPEKLPEEIEVVKEIKEPGKVVEEVVEEIKESESGIPVIKPPISFPKLPEDVQIPESLEERADLILDIYESIFLAMSIGASKIMGVSPARGLIKRFLPLQDCKTLLKDVDVKSNSSIDFDKIRANSEDIPLDKREKTLITDFSKIIDIITENYGKVMGYGAFRGIVRAEFKVITNSYGKPMDELGIKDKMHSELKELFK
jgi:predicted regulator of Ras-like GTPase activity (Roadblock/LC7/MglB family)